MHVRISGEETAWTDVLREIAIMKQLDHPNLVSLEEVSQPKRLRAWSPFSIQEIGTRSFESDSESQHEHRIEISRFREIVEICKWH
jgi:hypothetical protein